MRTLTRSLLIIGLAFLTSCSSKLPQSESETSSATQVSQVTVEATDSKVDASTLDPSKAQIIAQADFKAGKCNLYAVYGYSLTVPGLDKQAATSGSEMASFANEDFVYHIIRVEGTSDTGGPYDAQGKAFAESYNQTALKNCGAK